MDGERTKEQTTGCILAAVCVYVRSSFLEEQIPVHERHAVAEHHHFISHRDNCEYLVLLCQKISLDSN